MAINRHTARILALQGLYQHELLETPEKDLKDFKWEESTKITPETKEYGYEIISGVLKHKKNLMNLIAKYSVNRKEQDIVLMDKIILLISIYSLLYQKDIPENVVINEAVILAKDFSNMASYKFINGILDAVRKDTQ